MDPDSGMIITMMADGEGFRPAMAYDEYVSITAPLPFQPELSEPIPSEVRTVFTEESYLDEFIGRFEHAFGIPPSDAAMA